MEAKMVMDQDKSHRSPVTPGAAGGPEGETLARLLARVREQTAGTEVSRLKGDLDARLKAERGLASRLRSLATGKRLGLLVLALLALSVFVLLFMRRPDFGRYPLGRMAAALAAFAAAAAALFLYGLRPLYKPEPSRTALFLVAVVAVFMPWLFALLPHAYTGEWLVPAFHDHTPKAALACLIFGTVSGLPFVWLLWALERGSLGSARRSFFAVAAAALVGNIALQLHCPVPDPFHLALGHASVLLPLLGVYILLRRRQN
ncbi:MAG: DUF1109 family protein [Myxococcales bacterium]|nr:MAG: DUF1109 family protein [Myxococcales bacterium]